MSKQVNYQQFIATLNKLIKQKTTTNLILLTEDKHSLWLGLQTGVITTIIYDARRGKSAIPLIRGISGGKLSLDTNIKLPSMPDLPSTEVILTQLDVSPTYMATAEPIYTGTTEQTLDFDDAHSNLIIKKLQQLLKRYVGPVANMIMPGMIKQVGVISSETQLQALIDIMAKEVEGIGDTDKFRREATDIIDKA